MGFLTGNKAFLGIAAATILILFGGIYLLSSGTTPNPVSATILVPESAHQSDPQAPDVLVEFGDYQCPACGTYHPFVKQLLKDLSGKINYVPRHFPLPSHKNAKPAAYAAEAAALQGKFWEMHDKLYETQGEWPSSENPRDLFLSYAQEMGLDKDKFVKDMDSQEAKDAVERGLADGNLAKINATPTFFLNGRQIELSASYEDFKNTVEKLLGEK